MENRFYKLGIIGNPLSHSISPAIQKAALESAGLHGTYEKFETITEKIPELIKFFKENNFSGFNVTIPHKLEIIKYLNKIDETAQKIGAVNTVKITDDKQLVGYNTDIYGFCESLKDYSISNAIVMGCGGAALAVVFGLEKLGCKNLTIYARNPEKAKIFIENNEQKTNIKLSAKSFEDMDDISAADILVNATPLGTKGENESKSPIKNEILSTAKKSMVAYDLVYNPEETLFLKQAKLIGLKTISGLDMLIFQGAKAFEIWVEASPDTNKMKEVAKSALE